MKRIHIVIVLTVTCPPSLPLLILKGLARDFKATPTLVLNTAAKSLRSVSTKVRIADMKGVIILVTISLAQGLSLTKSKVRSCVGEEVIFTCTAAEGSSLSWDLIVTRDSNITHVFFYHDYETQRGRTTWSLPDHGFCVKLELVSNEPVLVSTLTANLTNIIIDAEVTCQQSLPVMQTRSGRFTLASTVFIHCMCVAH